MGADGLQPHEDRAKHIVQIVGDPGGEGPDALQPLRAGELGLDRALLRHVPADREHTRGEARGIAHERPPRLDGHRLARARANVELSRPRPAGKELPTRVVGLPAVRLGVEERVRTLPQRIGL